MKSTQAHTYTYMYTHIHIRGSFRNTCFVNQMLEGSAAGASEQTEPPLRDSSFTQKSIPSQWDFRGKSTPSFRWESILKTWEWGLERWLHQQFRALLLWLRTWVWFPASAKRLTTICSSS